MKRSLTSIFNFSSFCNNSWGRNFFGVDWYYRGDKWGGSIKSVTQNWESEWEVQMYLVQNLFGRGQGVLSLCLHSRWLICIGRGWKIELYNKIKCCCYDEGSKYMMRARPKSLRIINKFAIACSPQSSKFGWDHTSWIMCLVCWNNVRIPYTLP